MLATTFGLGGAATGVVQLAGDVDNLSLETVTLGLHGSTVCVPRDLQPIVAANAFGKLLFQLRSIAFSRTLAYDCDV